MNRVAIEINTTEMCAYGCNQIAKYKNGSGNLMCDTRSTKCPSVRKRNSKSLVKSYMTGKTTPRKYDYEQLPIETKHRMAWNAGKVTATFEYNGAGNHKGVLIKERGHKCEKCNRKTWNSLSITLELEHIDGDSKNNIKDNLLLLCPNCHSQTPTWRRKKSSIK